MRRSDSRDRARYTPIAFANSEHGADVLQLRNAIAGSGTRRNHIFFGRTVGRSNAANRAHHVIGHACVTDWGDELRLVRQGVVAMHFARVAPVTWPWLTTAGARDPLMWLKGEGDKAVCKVCDTR